MSARVYRSNRLKAKVIQIVKSAKTDLETLKRVFHSLPREDRSRLGYVARLISIESL